MRVPAGHSLLHPASPDASRNTKPLRRKPQSWINYGNQLHALLLPSPGSTAPVTCRARLHAEIALPGTLLLPGLRLALQRNPSSPFPPPKVCVDAVLLQQTTAAGKLFTLQAALAYQKAYKKLL